MRCSIHVDAGYLYAALATRVAGSAQRSAVTVDEKILVQRLIELVTLDCHLPILRVLWYDAARNGVPHADQKAIALLDNVKLRMGRLNSGGEQKGVDLRLGLDLVSLGHNKAASVAYLLSGDDDLTEAVDDAQALGMQVKLLTIRVNGAAFNLADNLSLSVDGALEVPDSLLSEVSRRRTSSEQPFSVGTPVPNIKPPALRPTGPLKTLPVRKSGLELTGAAEPLLDAKPEPAPEPTRRRERTPLDTEAGGPMSPLPVVTPTGAVAPQPPSVPVAEPVSAVVPAAQPGQAAVEPAASQAPTPPAPPSPASGPTPSHAKPVSRPISSAARPPLPMPPPKRPVAPMLPQAEVVPPATAATPRAGTEAITPELIVSVAEAVFDVWLSTATYDELDLLRAGRPNVPPAIDRILLTDLVARSGQGDISTPDRFALRKAFWDAVMEIESPK